MSDAPQPQSPLYQAQMRMACYLRDPVSATPPEGIEPRRLKIYEELIYNNVEGFIRDGFPVLRSLYQDDDWHEMVRLFIDRHRCHTPYFLKISEEFVSFLAETPPQRPCDPPFAAELAHYEWVELGLDVSAEEVPAGDTSDDLLGAVPRLSPLAWSLSYAYPVHLIGPGYQPEQPEEPTFLVVYRDREDQVHFMQINAAVSRLLALIDDNPAGATAVELLTQLAQEMGMEPSVVIDFGAQELRKLAEATILII